MLGMAFINVTDDCRSSLHLNIYTAVQKFGVCTIYFLMLKAAFNYYCTKYCKPVILWDYHTLK